MIEWTFPGYGKQQRRQDLGRLIKAELGEHAVFKEFRNLAHSGLSCPVPNCAGQPSSSRRPVPLKRYLRAVGYRVLVISPDPISFEKRLLPQDELTALAEQIARMERNATLSKLRRARVNVVEWDVTLPLRISMKQSLVERKR